MHHKITSVIICTMFLTIITISPAVLPKEIFLPQKQNQQFFSKQKSQVTPPQNVNIAEVYEQLIEKILRGVDPSEELSLLLSNPNIQTIIKELSDEQTLQTMQTLFSKKSIYLKLQALHQYDQKTNLIHQNESVQVFDQMLQRVISTNLTSDDAKLLFPEELLTEENKSILFSAWTNYLHTHPNIANILQTLYIDPFIFFIVFAISIFFWGFPLGGVAVLYPEVFSIGAMVTEALILGLAGSLLVDAFFTGDYPVLNQIIQLICSSPMITQTQLEVIVACLTSLIIMGAFMFLWNCPIAQIQTVVNFLGGGTIIVAPPLVLALIIASYSPSTNKSSLKTFSYYR